MPACSLKIGYKRAAVSLLFIVAVSNSGCLLATAGVASGACVGYAYYKGKTCELFNAGCDDAWAATRTALGELGMPVVKEERKGPEAFIESRTADGERVRIYVHAETSRFPAEGQLSRVCVRVATFGDRAVSDRILDQVGMHLAPAGLAGAPASQAAAVGVIQTGGLPSSLPAETPPPPLVPSEPPPSAEKTSP